MLEIESNLKNLNIDLWVPLAVKADIWGSKATRSMANRAVLLNCMIYSRVCLSKSGICNINVSNGYPLGCMKNENVRHSWWSERCVVIPPIGVSILPDIDITVHSLDIKNNTQNIFKWMSVEGRNVWYYLSKSTWISNIEFIK